VQLDPLKELYATKTDEELISLAQQKDSLVESAQLALVAELGRRNMEVPTVMPPVVSPSEGAESESDRTTTSPAPSRILWLGLFLLDTFLVYVCAIHLSPMLVGRWFAWILPALGIRTSVTPANWYLRHLELATIGPAVIAGYIDLGRSLPAIVGRQTATWRSGSAATCAWLIPAVFLLRGLLSFHAPSSVLYGSSMSAFGYYFDIQHVAPTFSNPLASDPVRVWAQMSVTAPFYAGIAFSIGALVWKHRLLLKLFRRLPSLAPAPPPSP
jgi:hypothetical protein